MDFLNLSENTELRAKVQLLRAYVQTKNNLGFQISQLKIRNSYRQSNTDFRDFKDMGNIGKLLHKKLQDVKSIHLALKSPNVQKHSYASVNKLLEVILSSEGNMKDIDNILSETMTSENYLELLREKYIQVKEIANAESEQYNLNRVELEKKAEKMKYLRTLEEEISEIRSEVENLNKENQMLKKKEQMINNNKCRSVEKVKCFKHLSESALKLRSKLLFREELQRNIRNAELELEYHFEKVNKEKQRMQGLDLESEENMKYAAKYELDLYELRREGKRQEMKMDNLYQIRDELIEQCKIEADKKIPCMPVENNEESLTISLTGLFSGFNEMKREKDSLIAENNKLKQKISSLFGAKV